MPSLGDFAAVNYSIKNVKRMTVVAMHKFIYESEGDRNNRQRLRVFDGFEYDEASPLFLEKAAYVKDNLSTADLVSICNLLHISYDADNLFVHIFNNLRKNTMLNNIEGKSDDDVDDDNDAKNDDNQNTVRDVQGIVRSHSDASFNSATSYTKNNIPLVNNITNNTNNFRNENRCYEDNQRKQNLSYSMQQYNSSASKFSLNFRDIEESVRTFDGSDKLPINVWIDEFEEIASVMCWDDFQKFIFAKRSLKGIAKLFIAGERGITD